MKNSFHVKGLIGLPLLAVATLMPILSYGQSLDLHEYAGVYEYQDKSTIVLVPERRPAGVRLVAVLGEAKYPLRSVGGDRFLNGVNDTVPFLRDKTGAITGFRERGVRYARLSTVVPLASRYLTQARPAGHETPIYRQPLALNDGIRVGRLRSGLDSTAVTGMIKRVIDGTYEDVHSVLVYHRGALVVEEYFYGYDAAKPHDLRSVTKSVISLVAGIGIDRQLLSDEQAPIMPLLGITPEPRLRNPDVRKQAIRLQDLLTMRTGLACNDDDITSPGNETRLYRSADWIRALLETPSIDAPGGRASYCSVAALAVGRAIENATHRSLPDFSSEVLFGPLGITSFTWDFRLDSSNARS
ncbi:MAG TPA: serine hydrolase domain-containing protein, partial [Gemmatimonadaceae bacterium]|nr:serine hydrolase domain-containing protein [Gemmatimonadaceae bacterium]